MTMMIMVISVLAHKTGVCQPSFSRVFFKKMPLQLLILMAKLPCRRLRFSSTTRIKSNNEYFQCLIANKSCREAFPRL